MKPPGHLSAVLQICRYSLRHWVMLALALAATAAFSGLEGAYLYLVGPYVEAFKSIAGGDKGAAADLETI